MQRDDLYLEYITLHNALGLHEQALEMLLSRQFHPWEGGEGKVPAQYRLALTELAKRALAAGDAQKAAGLLRRATVYPHSLGEGKLARRAGKLTSTIIWGWPNAGSATRRNLNAA